MWLMHFICLCLFAGFLLNGGVALDLSIRKRLTLGFILQQFQDETETGNRWGRKFPPVYPLTYL